MSIGEGMEYLNKLPDKIPVNRVLIHNNVRPSRRLGERGFRAWLELLPADAARLEVCECGWAAELGEHYRVRR